MLPNATLICIGHGFATRQMQYADAVFPVSQAVCAYLKKHGVTCPMVVVPNAVACPADLPEQASKVNRSVFTFGTMAVFRRKKRLDVLLTAAQILKNRDVDCRVLIAGRGHPWLYLHWLVWRLGLRECASLLPWVRDKAAFFSDLDVFCVTSRTETFGIALIEAMRYGIPVLSSDCGGPSEILSSHGVGGIVPVGDATALADALQAAMEDRLALEQQRMRAFLHVRQHYATDAVAPVLARATRNIVFPSDTVCAMDHEKCIREKYTSV